MPSVNLETAMAEIRNGKFRDALALLKECRSRISTSDIDSHDVLLAEVMQHMGENDEAKRIVSRKLAGGRLPARELSRSHLILGSVAFEEGGVRQSLEHLQKAVRFAKDVDDTEHVCRAQLKLVGTLSDISDPEGVAALLSETKRNVLQCGDASFMIALRVSSARLEAKRGLLESARSHLRVAETLLGDHPNVWLEGLLALDACCVSGLASDLGEAVNFATRALKCAESSGHARTRAAAIANLGFLHLCLGDFGRAEQYLRAGLRLDPHVKGVEVHVALLDSYAQLKLAREEWDECEALIDEVTRTLPDDPGFRPSWYELSVNETRIRLLLRLHRWEEACAVAARAIDVATSRSDRLLGALFRVLKADALIMLGRLDEAATLVADAAETFDSSSIATLAEIERLRGKLDAKLGRTSTARRHLDRALRILSVVGHTSSRTDARRDHASLDQMPRAAEQDVAPPPHEHWTHAIEAAATLVDVASDPEALGRELLSLASDTRCAHNVELQTRSPNGQRSVVARWAASPDAAGAAIPAGGRKVTLGLGRARNREFDLVARLHDGVEPRHHWLAIAKLTQAAIGFETAQREKRQRAPLWPVEPADAADAAIVAAREMVELLDTARRVATTNVPVLITGETGTGKELLARAIHAASPRAAHTFLPFNCTAAPRDMLDSQLFGHRRGAFTGAVESFPGVIRAAAGGTLFLDEIAEVSPEVQPKLLRFLESYEIHPLGETQPIRVDVRIIAATNANIDRLVSDGRFREDLFYRLNVIRLRVPPLRERREEIPPLVNHYLARYAAEFKKGELRLGEETLEYLLLFGWPGNVRQLINEVRRVAALAEPGAIVMPEHLSPEIRSARRTIPASERHLHPFELVVRMDQPLAAAIDHVERAMIRRAMESASGRLDAAAKTLGISRKGLYLKRQRLKLEAVPA